MIVTTCIAAFSDIRAQKLSIRTGFSRSLTQRSCFEPWQAGVSENSKVKDTFKGSNSISVAFSMHNIGIAGSRYSKGKASCIAQAVVPCVSWSLNAGKRVVIRGYTPKMFRGHSIIQDRLT